MSADTLLVEALGDDTVVACLEDGILAECVGGRAGDAFGAVYLGRVRQLHDGLQAAFVDIGLDRDGFLALPEARPPGKAPGGDRIGDYVNEGDAVLVQVLRDAIETKGPKLTRDITFSGRLLVYTPLQPGSRLSKKTTDADRERLHTDLTALLRADEGVVVRTAASEADRNTLARELAYLRLRWDEAERRHAAARAPAWILDGTDPAAELMVRESRSLRRVATDDARVFARLKAAAGALAPELTDRVALESGNLFEDAGVTEQLEAALEPVLPLAGGGSLIIQETAVGTVIDVNSGGVSGGTADETVSRVNEAAVDAVVRQIRLRNLCGRVLVDFLPVRGRRKQDGLLERLRVEIARVGIDAQVCGFTPGGLVEMIRQRRRPPLSAVLAAPCAACGGTGIVNSPRTLAMAALRTLISENRARPGARLSIRASRAVAEALGGAAGEARRAAEERLGRVIAIAIDEAPGAAAFTIEEEDGR